LVKWFYAPKAVNKSCLIKQISHIDSTEIHDITDYKYDVFGFFPFPKLSSSTSEEENAISGKIKGDVAHPNDTFLKNSLHFIYKIMNKSTYLG
jgi:hypothetical protein